MACFSLTQRASARKVVARSVDRARQGRKIPGLACNELYCSPTSGRAAPAAVRIGFLAFRQLGSVRLFPGGGAGRVALQGAPAGDPGDDVGEFPVYPGRDPGPFLLRDTSDGVPGWAGANPVAGEAEA